MFGFLFGKKKEKIQEAPPVAAAKFAPGTTIAYDPNLVASMMSDHQALFKIYGAILQHFAANDFKGVSQQLEQFRMAVQGHLLKENVKLYIYLEHQFKSDPATHSLIKGFRSEMDAIGKVLIDFLNKYKHIEVNPSLATTFKQDMEQIGAALTDRVSREESILYPLYS
jgi:hypothetical protein